MRKVFRIGLFREGKTQIVPRIKEFVEVILLKHREIPIDFGEKTSDKLYRNIMRWQLFGKIPVLVLSGGVKQEPGRFGGNGWHLIPVLKRLLLSEIIQLAKDTEYLLQIDEGVVVHGGVPNLIKKI